MYEKLAGQPAFVMAHSLEQRAPELKVTGNVPGTQPLGSHTGHQHYCQTRGCPHLFSTSAVY